MRKETLRNGVLLAIAAISASLEAPRLEHESLAAATAELANAPAGISRAIINVASRAGQSHVGFDTNVYPGDKAMDAWKRSGEYEWVGYYLKAPCHTDGSWSGTRQRLVDSGWGLAVIYVGQQTWGRRLTGGAPITAAKHSSQHRSRRRKHSTHTMTRRSKKPVAAANDRCSASFVSAKQGGVDARDAITQAREEGFPRGTVVFLDVEYMDVLPQPMRDYYRAWASAMLADGTYRPGIYAHTHNASTIYDDVSDVYTQAGSNDDPPFWIAGKGDFDPASSLPRQVGHEFASVWQGMLDVVRTHNGVQLPIDISVASVSSPSLR